MKGNPRVLAVQVHSLKQDKPQYIAPVDAWRINLPLAQLKKHTDWTIDVVTDWVEGYTNMEQAMKGIGEKYDILYTSYPRDPLAYAWIKALCDRYGVKHVVDFDDDIFSIDEKNPAIQSIYPGSKDWFVIYCIIQDADYLTCTNEHLAQVLRDQRPDKPADSVMVIPNYISTDFFYHDKVDHMKEKEILTIGYHGGTSHHNDLHKTGYLSAIQTLLDMYPYVKFKCVGMPIVSVEFNEDQYEFHPGSPMGAHGWNLLVNQLDFDIATAPLQNSQFNKSKSPIKFYEGTIMHAPMVVSNVAPYKGLVKHNETAMLAKTKDDWITHLQDLIKNPFKRQRLSDNAFKLVMDNYTMEKNWTVYRDMFLKVHHDD